MRRALRIGCALTALLCLCAGLLAGCGEDVGDTQGSAADTEVIDGRLTIRSEPPEIVTPPSTLIDVRHRLAGLVDFNDHDFSGHWYDPALDQEVIGVATDAGMELLRSRGLLDDPQVKAERVEWSLAAGMQLALEYRNSSVLKDRIVMFATRPQGDGFRFEITGDELSEAERTDLLTLPGRIEVTTGAGGGGSVD